jgi:hypothetical protein
MRNEKIMDETRKRSTLYFLDNIRYNNPNNAKPIINDWVPITNKGFRKSNE